MTKLCLPLFLLILFFNSCKQQETTAAEPFYETPVVDSTAIKLAEQQAKIQEQLDAQKAQDDLEKLAENTPVSTSNLTINNCTRQGTILNSGGLYKREDVKYITWSVDYVDNVVKAGGKTYGTLYAKYMLKDKYDNNSWSTFDYQGSFTEITSNSNGYTRKYNMVDDGAESGTWTNGIGSESGYDFDRGKWKIELYWDRNNEGRAII